MTVLNISTEGLEEAIQSLSSIQVESANAERIEKVTFILLWEVKKETPVDKWFLRNRIKSKFSRNQWEVFTKVPYAIFVHESWIR